MRKKKLDLQRYQRLTLWKRAKGAAEGTTLFEQAASHYEECAAAFRELVGKIARDSGELCARTR